MIKYRKSQKEFALPLLGAAMKSGQLMNYAFMGSSVAGMFQGAKGNKLMAEQNAEMEKANKEQQKIERQRLQQEKEWQEQQLKLQKKALKQGVNPFGDSSILNNVTGTPTQPLQPPPAVFQNNYSQKQKNYSIFSVAKNIAILASRNKGVLIGNVLSGAATSAGIYVMDKAIQKDKTRVEKYAERERIPGFSQKAYSVSRRRVSLKGSVFSFAMGASIPAVSYAVEKKLGKDMATETKRRLYPNNSYGEKSFSVPAKKASSVLSALSKVAGGGGAKGVRDLGIQISAIGKKTGNKATKKLGAAILKHPNAALIASIPGGLAVMGGTFTIGDKIATNIIQRSDKDAYKYVNSKDKEIE